MWEDEGVFTAPGCGTWNTTLGQSLSRCCNEAIEVLAHQEAVNRYCLVRGLVVSRRNVSLDARPVISECIIHAARMVVDRLDLATDDQLWERSRFARKLVVEELKEWGLQPDHNLLLTAGLREKLMQLETTQILWEIHYGEEVEGERELWWWDS